MFALALAAAAATAAPKAGAVAPIPASAASTAPRTAQQLFDAANAALGARQWDVALTYLATLKAKPALFRDPQIAEAILARQAAAFRELGRTEYARSAAVAAVALRPDAAALATDRFDVRLLLSKLAYLDFDYPGSRAEADRALAIAPAPADSFNALVQLTRATMFDEGPDALAYADRMLAAAAPLASDKKIVGDAHILHARTLIAHGNVRAGYDELKHVLADRGGLTPKITLSDAALRADLAMAALLDKDDESARKYIANTGAGRVGDQAFATAADMNPPPCGGDADIRPDDMVVVELGIGTDGAVVYAAPVFATRLGPIAGAFARAVAGWSWQPQTLAGIPPFFRAAARVELRCSTEAMRPPLTIGLEAAFGDWLKSRGITQTIYDRANAKSMPLLKADLAGHEAAPGLAQLPAFLALGTSPAVPFEDRKSYLTRAEALIAPADAPVRARAFVRLAKLGYGTEASVGRSFQQQLRVMLDRPDYAGDAQVANVIRLMAADTYTGPVSSEAVALLRATAEDSRLTATDPLKVGALIRLASLQYRKGDLAAARSSYERTGLTAQQCALADASPIFKGSNATGNDFPLAAMAWGFEGWVRTQFDVAADGHTLNQRAIIAYPPFVFRDAAVGVAKGVTYRISYRPTGMLGCGGASTVVRFVQ